MNVESFYQGPISTLKKHAKSNLSVYQKTQAAVGSAPGIQ